MGKQVKGWVPPDDAVENQTSNEGQWTPPEDAIADESVKKKEEPAPVTRSVGASASVGHGQPSGQPTTNDTPTASPKDRLQEKVTTYVNAAKNSFTQEAEKKRAEFQAIINADGSKTKQVNEDFKKFLDDRQKVYDSDMAKWFGIYNDQYADEQTKFEKQAAKEDFDKNRTTNPFKSVGKTAWLTFSKDLPSQAFAARALGRSVVKNIDQKAIEGMQELGIQPVDKSTASNIEEMFDSAVKLITGSDNKSTPTERRTDAENKLIINDIKSSINLSKASAEKKKYLVNSLDKIKDGDFVDWVNYAASAVGQGVGQILPSIGTHGAASLVQEIGSIYLDSVQKIAKDEGISIDEVIKQGKDEVVYPLLFGVGAGLLDAIGAKGVAGAVTKKQIMNSFRNRALSVVKAAGEGAGTESVTEGVQTVLEQIGVNKAAGKSWRETLEGFNWSDVVESALQGGIAGLFLSGGGKALSNTFEAITAKPASPVKARTMADALRGGATLSLQADVPSTVHQEVQNMDPADPASVDAAAAKIEEVIDQTNPENAIQKQSTDEVSVQPAAGTGQAVEVGAPQPGTEVATGAQTDIENKTQSPEAITGETQQITQTNGQDETKGQGRQEELLTTPEKQAEPKPASTSAAEDVQARIDKLDPNESQGYGVTQNRAIKEQMHEMPERAKVAFDIMDFAKKVWPKDLVASMEKTPLASIGQFFYGDANSVKEWVDMQIQGERQDIENRKKTIESLQAKPKQTKSDKDSIAMWQDSIARAEQRIQEYEKAYENEQKTKSPDGEGDAVQPVNGTDISGTEDTPAPDGGTNPVSPSTPISTQEQQNEPVAIDASTQQGPENSGGNVPTNQAPAAQGGIPTEPPPTTDSVALEQSDDGNVSGIKKALVPESKVEETPIERRSTEQMLESAKQNVDSGRINPKAIVDEIAKGTGRALQPDEVSALVYYKAQLDNKADSLNQELIGAIDSGDLDTQARTRVQLDALNDEIDRYHEMALKTAYEQSLAFRLRQMLLDNEYNLASQILRYKAANNGEISPEVEAKFKELDEQLKAANLRIKALEEQQAKAAAEQAGSAIKADLQRQKDRRLKVAQSRKAKINEFFDSLKVKQDPNKLNNVFQVVGESVYNGAIEAMRTAVLAGSDVATAIQAGVDYINEHYRGTDFKPDEFQSEMEPKISKVVPTNDADTVPSPTLDEEGRLHIPTRMIRHFAEISDDIDQLTDNIFRAVKEVIPDVTRREVLDAITRYGETKNLSKDELDTKIREMKRIGRLISSLEDVQAGERPKRSGLQRDKPTDKERRLMKEVKDAMKDLPVDNAELDRQWRTALDAVKSRLKNQISDLENQIETGEKTPKKKGIEYDEEANALKEQRDKLRAIIQQIEGKPKMSDEQKIRMAIAGVERNIAELERRISTRYVSSNRRTSTPATPELQALRDRRNQLSEVYRQLQDELGATEQKRLEIQKKALQAAIDRYQKRIDTGDFVSQKKKPVTPDAEAIKLKLERDKIKREFDVMQEKVRYANRPMSEKIWDAVVDIFNLPKSFLASIDMSAPFRQGFILTVSDPKSGARSFGEMFRQAFSEQKANEWLLRLRETDAYAVMKNAKLYLAEPTTRHTAREEQFLSNFASKLPIIGPAIKASERAYTGFLNKLRADVFTNGADRLREQGITPENNPEAYKALASFINNATGRGNLGGAEAAAPVLNALFFSPRYVASRINLLNPVTYAKMPAPVRKMALKSMAAYVGFNVMLLAIADAAFDDLEVEWDPRSTDFGKFRVGDTRYDPWAGFQQVVRFVAQMVSGQRKSTKTGEISEINGIKFPFETRADVALRFIRSKLSPSAATIANVLAGEDMVGNEVTLKTEVAKNIIPLYLQDMQSVYQEDGATGIVTTFIPAFFGVGVQSYGEKTKITPTVDPEGMVGALNKKHKYTIPEQDRRDLSKTFEREVSTEVHDQYIQLRDQEIKRLVDRYKFRLEDISDRDIYDKSMDAIVREAGRKAKYQIARENKWDAEGFKEGNKFRLQNYVKRDGKVVARASLLR